MMNQFETYYPEIEIDRESPILENKTKKGLKKFWKGFIDVKDNQYYLVAEYWQELKDGSESKHQYSTPKLIKRKNVGKKNETSLEEQSYSELISLINKQLDKNYFPIGKEQHLTVLPMLAHNYEKHYKKLIGCNYSIQPKLDGVRTLFSNDKGMYSRKGKNLIPSVNQLFPIKIPNNIILDGELLLPPPFTFQESVSAIKREKESTSKLIYVLYDLIDLEEPDLTYDLRIEAVKKIVEENNLKNVEVIDYFLIHKLNNKDDIQSYHNMYIRQGYEGSIIRNVYHPYEIDSRSYSLLKYKDFITEEYKIIGFDTETVTSDNEIKEAAIFICETADKKQFRVRPKASVKDRVQMLLNKKSYLNKLYTVQFQEKTDSDIPRFPVGIAIRDYE